jgi:hypothetical protein
MVLLRRVFDREALDPVSFVEFVLKPIENAGYCSLLLVGQKAGSNPPDLMVGENPARGIGIIFTARSLI